MGKVSKYQVSKDVYERMFELLVKAIAETKVVSEAAALLLDLLSPVERIMVAKRLAIAVLLSKETSYDVIQNVLKVSRPTIAGVNANLKFHNRGYRRFTLKLAKEEKWQKLWEKIEDAALGQVQAREKGSGIWLKLQGQERKQRQRRTSL